MKSLPRGRLKYQRLNEEKIRNPMQYLHHRAIPSLNHHHDDEYEMKTPHVTDGMEIEENNLRNNELIQKNGTILSSFYNLANTILGSGMLGLPYAYSRAGWLLGSFYLIISATIASFSLHLLTICALTQSMPSSFHKVGKSVFSSASILIDLAVAIKCFGVATSYLIVIGDLMPAVFVSNSAIPLIFKDRRLWITLFFIVVTGLSFLKNLNSLKFTSFMSILFVVLLTILIATYSMNLSYLDPCESISSTDTCRGGITVATLNPSTLSVFPIFIFSFTCHQVIFVSSFKYLNLFF